jgi:hypothetical protein
MTSHAQPVDTPPERVVPRKRSRKPKRDGEGDSVSVAKMGMIGTIGGAVVTAITTIVLGVSHDGGTDTPKAAGQTFTPKVVSPSPLGAVDQVAINQSGTEVTITGSAEKNVDSVVVLIGPRQSGGQYWAASANVVNQQWKLAVATDPHVPEPYEIRAYYRQQVEGAAGGAPIQGAAYFISPRPAETPTTTPPPAPVVNCAEQFGDQCFNGPGWGPPSVYQSGH